MKQLKYLAIFGNVAYVLWIIWNGMEEGFKATIVQQVSYLGIILLLILNAYLLSRKK